MRFGVALAQFGAGKAMKNFLASAGGLIVAVLGADIPILSFILTQARGSLPKPTLRPALVSASSHVGSGSFSGDPPGQTGAICYTIEMAEPTNHELSERIAVLEEKMNTSYERMNAAFERLRTDMADWKTDMANWKTDMADWKTDMAKRDNRLIISVLGIMVAGITILGFILTSTPTP